MKAGGGGGGEEKKKRVPGVKMCRVRVSLIYDKETAKYQQAVVTLAAPEHTTHHFISPHHR